MPKSAVIIIGIGILLFAADFIYHLHYPAMEEQLDQRIHQNLHEADWYSEKEGTMLGEIDQTRHYLYLYGNGYALLEKGWNDQYNIVKSGIGFALKPGAIVVEIAEEHYVLLIGSGTEEMDHMTVTIDDISINFDISDEEDMFIHHRLVPRDLNSTIVEVTAFDESGQEIEEKSSIRNLEEIVKEHDLEGE